MLTEQGQPRLRVLPDPLHAHPDWKIRYSSDLDDLVSDFLTPALASAKRYDRAVGYFRVSALAEIGRSLEPFFDARNKMRLVASVEFDERDVEAISQGLELRDAQYRALQRVTDRVEAEVDRRPDFRDPVSLLTGLLQHGLLDIYIAIGRIEGGPALYHEKIGVIEDHENNFVTFEGSPNETGAALRRNIESFPIHRSWIEGESAHAIAAKEAVDGLFSDPPRRNVDIRRFPEALADDLIRMVPPRTPADYRPPRPRPRTKGPIPSDPPEPKYRSPMIPSDITLHDYQGEAVRGWLEANGRGRFEMATGTGKTITALAAAVQVAQQCEENGESLWIVVLVPDGPLVQQWEEEAKGFGFRPVTAPSPGWRDRVQDELLQLKHGRKASSMLISTFDSALANKAHLVDQIRNHEGEEHTARVMLIADEAHGLGAPTRQKLLIERIDYRLGLTATFSRHFDDEGTELLNQYFDGHITRISIHDAIYKYKTLVEYRYHPVIVELEEDEARLYKELSGNIAELYARSQASWLDFENRIQHLLRDRADILKHAVAKVGAFRQIVSSLKEKTYMLVYTAEGVGPIGGEIRQDDQLALVLEELGVDMRRFNGDRPRDARVFLQEELDSNRIDCLMAMKCLDEGIDIPEARVAFFVASTTNPRQYIQRRGRVLRKPKSSASEKDSADLYDFIVTPPRDDHAPETFEIERRLVAREVMRARELASSGANHHQALLKLDELVAYYQLDDLYVDDDEDDSHEEPEASL